jgi:hypothetical protein
MEVEKIVSFVTEIVKEDEFRTQFILSSGIALCYGFLAYYSKKYCSELTFETKVKRSHLSNLMSIYFSSTVFMCSVAQWISLMYQYVNYGHLNLETKNVEIAMLYACAQACVWDTIMGFEYYPDVVKYRLLKYVIYMGTAIYSLFTNDSKLVTLVWISEYPDLLKEHTRYMGFRIEKMDQMIYQMVYVSFKILFPMMMLYHFYVNEQHFSRTLLSIYFLCVWFDVVQFTVWIVESIFMKDSEKEKSVEMKKNE